MLDDWAGEVRLVGFKRGEGVRGHGVRIVELGRAARHLAEFTVEFRRILGRACASARIRNALVADSAALCLASQSFAPSMTSSSTAVNAFASLRKVRAYAVSATSVSPRPQ